MNIIGKLVWSFPLTSKPLSPYRTQKARKDAVSIPLAFYNLLKQVYLDLI